MQEKKSKAIKHIKVTLSAFCLFLEQHCQALIHTSDFHPSEEIFFFLNLGQEIHSQISGLCFLSWVSYFQEWVLGALEDLGLQQQEPRLSGQKSWGVILQLA